MSGKELEFEVCIICEGKTDRAGRYDDSIYSEWKTTVHVCDLRADMGEEVGPLCEGCYCCLDALGLIDEA